LQRLTVVPIYVERWGG